MAMFTLEPGFETPYQVVEGGSKRLTINLRATKSIERFLGPNPVRPSRLSCDHGLCEEKETKHAELDPSLDSPPVWQGLRFGLELQQEPTAHV